MVRWDYSRTLLIRASVLGAQHFILNEVEKHYRYKVLRRPRAVVRTESRDPKMNRRDLIKNTLLAAGAVSSTGALAPEMLAQLHGPGGEPPKDQEKIDKARSAEEAHRTDKSARMPNILWICPDQMRGDVIHSLGNPLINTPCLDKLVSESVAFTNAFCQTSICSPSRGSFMTGRYPRQTNLKSNSEYIRPTEKLVSRILADQGYDCGLSGKLHLSPCDQGFVEQRIDDGYRVFEWSHDIGNKWPGKNQWLNWLEKQNVKWPAAPKEAHETEVWGAPIDPKYTQTAWCSDVAIDFMKQHKPDQPWMMSVHIYQPHSPYHPTEEYLKRYNPSKMPLPPFKQGELDNKPAYQMTDHKGAYGGHGKSFTDESDRDHQVTTAAYYAMIEQVDTEVGRMMKTLEEQGMADNTVVIFMSDHGSMMGDHGIYEKGPYFYDGLNRVPLIMRWPGKYKAGLKIDSLVELVDIAPTVMEAAGLTIPAGMQGKSLTPVLTGATTSHRDSVYMEFYNACSHYTPTPMNTCVRTADWKLGYYQTLGTGELYDLRKDPGEFNNLWGKAQSMDAQAQMLQLLSARMIQSTDPLGVHVF
jgi:arylsulfatase